MKVANLGLLYERCLKGIDRIAQIIENPILGMLSIHKLSFMHTVCVQDYFE